MTALPASQTAPVAEFRCLFTHDVRRKQKRWQDGYLKFHTFNNRVMVSDQARNHIGDTYWKDSNELHEGDELSLDKGVLVEVAEAMGTTQTDLAPLFERKTKEAAREAPARPTPSVTTRPYQRPSSVAPSSVARAGTQLRHKSLNTLLGTPRGPVGKAQPMKSPYEARKETQKENELAEERAPKRQKVAQPTEGWRASSPVQREESPPNKTTSLWARTVDAKAARAPQARMPPVSKVITISSESDHIPVPSSDVTLPGTPAKAVKPSPGPPVPSAPMRQASVFDEPLPIETPKLPRPKIRLPKPKPVETPKRPAPNSSPPVSASNRLTNVDFAVQPVREPQKKPSPEPPPPRNLKAKSLRLSTGVKRGTLLCQSMPMAASRTGSEPRAPRPSVPRARRLASKEPSPTVYETGRSVAPARTVSNVKPSSPIKGRCEIADTEPAAAVRQIGISPLVAGLAEDDFDDPEIVHGLMDQQLLISPSIEAFEPRRSPSQKTTASKPNAGMPIPNDILKGQQGFEMSNLEVESDEPKSVPTKPTSKATRTLNMKTKKSQKTRNVSPPHDLVFKSPAPPSRQTSPAHTNAAGSIPRTTSTSPTKTPLSTGGFRKKPKRIAKEDAVTVSVDHSPPVPQDKTTTKPPRAEKRGALISTTELASLLQKRTRKDDPIEDDNQGTSRSSARKIRRVRSENDAPIPSTAQEWEKLNLPKASSDLTEADIAEPEPKRKVSALAALVKRTDPRKKFQRAKSLSVETNVNPVEVEVDLPSPIIDKDVGPWSTEAGDLFDWKPPNRGEAVI